MVSTNWSFLALKHLRELPSHVLVNILLTDSSAGIFSLAAPGPTSDALPESVIALSDNIAQQIHAGDLPGAKGTSQGTAWRGGREFDEDEREGNE